MPKRMAMKTSREGMFSGRFQPVSKKLAEMGMGVQESVI